MLLNLQRSQASKEKPLTDAKAAAKLEVAEIVRTVREHYLLPITGQDMTYEEKERQAVAFLTQDPLPVEGTPGFGFIFGEVGLTADTAEGVARAVIAKGQGFRELVGPAIETARIRAGKAVKAATTEDEVRQALSDLKDELSRL